MGMVTMVEIKEGEAGGLALGCVGGGYLFMVRRGRRR